DVVFEAPQRADFSGPDHGPFANQADAGVAGDFALGDDTSRDPADSRRFEGLFDFRLAEGLLDLYGFQHPLHRVAEVLGDFVDHGVGADVDSLALGGAPRVGEGPHVEADDDRVGGRREHHVGLVDAAGLGMDDVDPDLLLRDLGDLVLKRLQRAGDVGLDDDVELLDVPFLGAW